MKNSHHAYVNFFNKMNFGDDVFVMMLAKKYPQIKFHISGAYDELEAFKNQPNIQIHKDNKASSLIKKISLKLFKKDMVYRLRARKCGCCVTIGGSIFMEPNAYLKEYFRDKNSKILAGKKNVIMGANFGPYKSVQFKEFFKEYFEKIDFVSFRDKYSYELFQENDSVNYAPDILFGMTDVFSVEKKKTNPYIVISVIDRAKEARKYFDKMCEIVKYYRSKGYEVVLLSMCEVQADLQICQELKSEFQDEGVKVMSYRGNITEIMSCIRNAEYVIASRFHAIVTSLCYEVPCYPVVYSNKTENLLADIAYTGEYTTVDEFFEQNMENIDKNRQKEYKPNVKKMSMESQKHFSYLDNYFAD